MRQQHMQAHPREVQARDPVPRAVILQGQNTFRATKITPAMISTTRMTPTAMPA